MRRVLFGQGRPVHAYRDPEGRVLQAYANGRTRSHEEAVGRGWKEILLQGKHRYLFLLPENRHHRQVLRGTLAVPQLEYPKRDVSANRLFRSSA